MAPQAQASESDSSSVGRVVKRQQPAAWPPLSGDSPYRMLQCALLVQPLADSEGCVFLRAHGHLLTPPCCLDGTNDLLHAFSTYSPAFLRLIHLTTIGITFKKYKLSDMFSNPKW